MVCATEREQPIKDALSMDQPEGWRDEGGSARMGLLKERGGRDGRATGSEEGAEIGARNIWDRRLGSRWIASRFLASATRASPPSSSSSSAASALQLAQPPPARRCSDLNPSTTSLFGIIRIVPGRRIKRLISLLSIFELTQTMAVHPIFRLESSVRGRFTNTSTEEHVRETSPTPCIWSSKIL